jgi:hypothetical protein
LRERAARGGAEDAGAHRAVGAAQAGSGQIGAGVGIDFRAERDFDDLRGLPGHRFILRLVGEAVCATLWAGPRRVNNRIARAAVAIRRNAEFLRAFVRHMFG